MALIKEYFELTQQYFSKYGENTILLMQVGSFFEVYALLDKATDTISGSKIEEFSRMCDLNIAEKNSSIGKDVVLMAGFKDNGLDKYMKKIQEAGYTSVVYTQEETDIAGKFIRKCAGVSSPGTFFNNDTTVLTNNTTCIWIELVGASILKKEATIIVGISNIDIYTGKTSVFEFSKKYMNNPTTYDELERFNSIYNPSEAIIITNLPREKEIDDIINFANIRCDLIHRIHLTAGNGETEAIIKAKNCEKQTYQHELLRRFYGLKLDRDNISLFNEHNVATQSFCFLLDFMYQHSPHLVNKIHKPVFENCSKRLVLANHSLKQLNIIDDQNYNGRHSSVLKMLNLCLTPMGKRKFAYNFLHPTTDVCFLQREYDITEYILSLSLIETQNIKTKLAEIRDIAKWERQVFMKKISPKSFASLYKNIGIIRAVYDIVNEDRTIMEYLGQEEINTDAILDFIRTNINLDLAKDIDQLQGFDMNFINKTVNTKLDEAQELLLESMDKLVSIQTFLNSLIERGEKKAASGANEFVKMHETDKNHFSLISTSRRSKILEDLLPARSEKIETLTYISSYSGENKSFSFTFSKKNMRFEKHTGKNNFISNNEIAELCRNIHGAKVALKEIITSVYQTFISQFEEFQEQLEKIIEFITLIDMIYAKATIAKKYGYCKPVLDGTDDSTKKSFVKACDLRHCLIEQLQQSEIYVANDIALGISDSDRISDRISDSSVDGILLYGTNAVGKTSLIRALGIAVIMAQSGLFVPCSQFIFKPYKYIFTRILGNDNIFKGLSTFAVEMSELRTILNYADENSLILGDELCSGTENTSAVSIFVAGIQKMATMRSSFIFATHLHEIVGYDEITDLKTVALKHMSVIYNREKDCLEYDRKLRDGPGNSMYGLEVCKSLNLPAEFLDAAYAIREKYASTTRTTTSMEGISILSLKTSHYNSRKIMGLCEKCGKLMGKEVHHLEHQKDANNDGIIVKNGVPFHKNIAANLMTVCEKCHDEFHRIISPNEGAKLLLKPKRKSPKQVKIV
jgi:DNA mismatch repair protein MutS